MTTGLTQSVAGKRAQWAGFLRRSRLTHGPALEAVIDTIAAFAGPVLAAAAGDRGYPFHWPPGGPWEPAS